MLILILASNNGAMKTDAPRRPKARRSDCYYRRYLGPLAAQGRRIHCCSAATLGHWRQAACCLPCLLSKAPGHLSLQLSPLAMGPAPALGG